jgi:hypothetical protein
MRLIMHSIFSSHFHLHHHASHLRLYTSNITTNPQTVQHTPLQIPTTAMSEKTRPMPYEGLNDGKIPSSVCGNTSCTPKAILEDGID